jgi:hypothetical protein
LAVTEFVAGSQNISKTILFAEILQRSRSIPSKFIADSSPVANMRPLRGKLTSRAGAGPLPALLLDQGLATPQTSTCSLLWVQERKGEANMAIDIERVGDSADDEAGGVSTIAAVSASFDTVATAVRTESNTLKLITWKRNPPDANKLERITRDEESEETTGEIENTIGLAHVGFGDGQAAYYVTAIRASGGGESKVIAWDANDRLERKGEARVGLAEGALLGFSDVIRVVPMPGIFQDPATGERFRLLVAAERSAHADGRLDLVPVRLNEEGNFESTSGSPGPDAGQIEADMSLAVFRPDRIATSVRTEQGNLLVITWNVTPGTANSVTRVADGTAGAAQLIRSAVSALSGHLITSVKTGGGNLMLIAWEISEESVDRRGDSGEQAEEISSNALVALPNTHQMISAVQTAEGTLKLIPWGLFFGPPPGKVHIVREEGEAEAGTASQITAVLAGDRIITAVRSGAGNLLLINWKFQDPL